MYLQMGNQLLAAQLELISNIVRAALLLDVDWYILETLEVTQAEDDLYRINIDLEVRELSTASLTRIHLEV